MEEVIERTGQKEAVDSIDSKAIRLHNEEMAMKHPKCLVMSDYELVTIPAHSSRTTQGVWLEGVPIGTVAYDAKKIYSLMITRHYQRLGHGRAIAMMLMRDGREPIGVLPEAEGFWSKVRVAVLIERAKRIEAEAAVSIGSKAIRLWEQAKSIRREATMERWLCSK